MYLTKNLEFMERILLQVNKHKHSVNLRGFKVHQCLMMYLLMVPLCVWPRCTIYCIKGHGLFACIVFVVSIVLFSLFSGFQCVCKDCYTVICLNRDICNELMSICGAAVHEPVSKICMSSRAHVHPFIYHMCICKCTWKTVNQIFFKDVLLLYLTILYYYSEMSLSVSQECGCVLGQDSGVLTRSQNRAETWKDKQTAEMV